MKYIKDRIRKEGIVVGFKYYDTEIYNYKGELVDFGAFPTLEDFKEHMYHFYGKQCVKGFFEIVIIACTNASGKIKHEHVLRKK